MRFHFLISLFLAISISGIAQAKENGPATVSSLIDSEKDCFSGRLGDYKKLVATNIASANRPPVDLSPALSKEQYEAYRSTVICRRFKYQVDGVEVEGIYSMPKNLNAPLPVIVFNRGGNGAYGKIGPGTLFRRLLPLAVEGYFVIATQYRGSNTEKDKVSDQFGGEDLNDVKQLVRIVDTINFLDNKKIGIMGESRGGMMSLMAARSMKRFSTIIVLSTPTNLLALSETPHGKQMEKRVYKRRIPDFESKRTEELKKRSAYFWVDELDKSVPILIVHARDDNRVDASDPLTFAGRLQSVNHPYKLVIYDSGGHSLGGLADEVDRLIIQWFSKNI